MSKSITDTLERSQSISNLENKLKESKRELIIFQIGYNFLFIVTLVFYLVVPLFITYFVGDLLSFFGEFGGIISYFIWFGLFILLSIYFYDFYEFVFISIKKKIMRLKKNRLKLLNENLANAVEFMKRYNTSFHQKKLECINKEIKYLQIELLDMERKFN